MTIADIPMPAEKLAEWDGLCMELVDELLHSHPTGDILYVDLEGDALHCWKYHEAIVVDGIVHDPWFPDVRLPPSEYVERVFGDVPWELNPGADDD